MEEVCLVIMLKHSWAYKLPKAQIMLLNPPQLIFQNITVLYFGAIYLPLSRNASDLKINSSTKDSLFWIYKPALPVLGEFWNLILYWFWLFPQWTVSTFAEALGIKYEICNCLNKSFFIQVIISNGNFLIKVMLLIIIVKYKYTRNN